MFNGQLDADTDGEQRELRECDRFEPERRGANVFYNCSFNPAAINRKADTGVSEKPWWSEVIVVALPILLPAMLGMAVQLVNKLNKPKGVKYDPRRSRVKEGEE